METGKEIATFGGDSAITACAVLQNDDKAFVVRWRSAPERRCAISCAPPISPYITFTWGKVPSLDRYPNLSLDIAAKRFANCAVGARC